MHLHALGMGIRLGLEILAAWAVLSNPALAQSVTLAGMLGGKALVIVDAGTPKAVAMGDSHKGVKVVSTLGDSAVLEIAGKRLTMHVGDAPASVGGQGGAPSTSDRIVMTAGSGGHFFTQGQINGRAVNLVVDTGATSVSIGVDDAQRLGLDYKAGQPVRMSTANGTTNGWRIKLTSMRVGDVDVYGVDAVVTSGAMPFVLLGNSFLTRFQMTRTNDQMVLLKRF
jgi:aspartyl protease family protein